jgi:hypothetical protein
VPVPGDPLTREDTLNRLWIVAIILTASATIVIVAFLAGILFALWA